MAQENYKAKQPSQSKPQRTEVTQFVIRLAFYPCKSFGIAVLENFRRLFSRPEWLPLGLQGWSFGGEAAILGAQLPP